MSLSLIPKGLIDTMFVCHFVDPGFGVEKEGKQNEEGIDFETGG